MQIFYNFTAYLKYICLWLVCTAIMPALAASATTEPPITYSRSTLILEPNNPATEAYKNGLAFNVDIRNAKTIFNRSGWYNFAQLEQFEGLLLVFSEPELIAIGRTNDFIALDILMIDSYGKIFQILPSITLSQLAETIPSSQETKVLLYLQGGSVETLGIQPGDFIKHSMFKKRPRVMTEPIPSDVMPNVTTPVVKEKNVTTHNTATAPEEVPDTRTEDNKANQPSLLDALLPKPSASQRRKPANNP